MKKIITTFLIILVIASGGIFTYNFLNNKAKINPLKSSESKVKISVKSGDSYYSVFQRLKDEGKLTNIYIVKSNIKKKGSLPIIKPGVYEVNSNIGLDELIDVLSKGGVREDYQKVTIPEGYNIEQIAEVLDKKGVISKTDFIAALKVYNIPQYVKKVDNRRYMLEGFLFPDTYEFKKGIKGNEVIDVMIKRFEEVINKLQTEYPSKISNEKLDSIVTLASVVEKEADSYDERRKVVSVFNNRQKNNMKLQSCATVIYALGKHKDKLYYKDLEIESPYNTYKVDGLPVGPICSPSLNSLKAALDPENANYLYFVSNNDGTHFFTNDYNKFLEVKKKTQGED